MNTDKLRELALVATEGPWILKWRHYVIPQIHADRPVGGSTNNDQDRDNYAQLISTSTDDNHGRGKAKDNAAYIAAANPAAILELLDALKEAKRSRDLCHRIAGCDQFNCCLDGCECPESILDKS